MTSFERDCALIGARVSLRRTIAELEHRIEAVRRRAERADEIVLYASASGQSVLMHADAGGNFVGCDAGFYERLARMARKEEEELGRVIKGLREECEQVEGMIG